MNKHIHSILQRKNIHMIALAVVVVGSSFSLGIQSAGDVQPISLIQAGSIELPGDMDGSGIVDHRDVRIILEVAQGYAPASPTQLLADPNRDGVLTIDDAIRVLSTL